MSAEPEQEEEQRKEHLPAETTGCLRAPFVVHTQNESVSRNNMRLFIVLLLALVSEASDESCLNRCENGFDSQRTCQCDSMCKYYKSCCSDYETVCGKTTRGDTFVFAEDDDYDLPESTTPPGPSVVSPSQPPVPDFSRRLAPPPETSLQMTKPPRLMNPRVTNAPHTVAPKSDPSPTTDAPRTHEMAETTTVPITAAPDPDAEVCGIRPFDSFMQLKNGSIYAFRGKYFFELDQNSVLPGYPKLIEDVWGITGPIDAAFTRINCQGKTYIFKGDKYWRFNNGVLEDDYPREISVGFEKIPDHVDAAFALPAHSHHGKEKVYFFKGNQYYVYEFLHQPSHEECAAMSERSPSTLFRRYTDLYYSNYERYFTELYSDWPQHRDKHHFINRDWVGLQSPVDAAMAGRIYVAPWRSGRWSDYQPDQQWGQQNRWQRGQRRWNRSPSWGSIAEQGMNMGQGFAERGMEMGMRLAERRMEMEERLGRDWDRRRDQDWDQSRRRDQDWDQSRRWDRYNQNNRGNYDSRNERFFQRDMPIQSVYFFKGDKYYRVDLRTKRVDSAMPPYPRSIAKYWLGCSNTTGAEKK
ncbi:vitronectin a [Austrofundulus limnaeus]|uniref:Vitronectin a n=1 Tax=Austrofundulus limnaeus TaxID=52670 RepID=A0A2I4AZ38_AUSLI|nr:PREDICTED: vitronectin [Austrofundulus limnaeus]